MTPYASRINRVLDYIDNHIDEKLTLEGLASEACFSHYHFIRVFQSQIGEKPFEYIHRIRMEKAAQLLINRPDLKVIDIALNSGFTNAASFSRAFRERFDSTPSLWRQNPENKTLEESLRSVREEKGFNWKPRLLLDSGQPVWNMTRDEETRRVWLERQPDLQLAYLRYTGPYKGDGSLFLDLWNRLYRWVGPAGLIEQDSRYLSLYHDNPELTDDTKLRVTVAISTTKAFTVPEGMGRLELKGGLIAVIPFLLKADEYQKAWDWAYGEWLPQSGYFPDDRPSFERFPQDRDSECSDRHAVEICIPVIPGSAISA